jgi:hypothetical protein
MNDQNVPFLRSQLNRRPHARLRVDILLWTHEFVPCVEETPWAMVVAGFEFFELGKVPDGFWVVR